MKAKLNFKGRRIEFEVEKLSEFGKYRGLMFKKPDTKALLFEFEKPCRQAIHSFFCPDFLAVWLNNGKITDYKLVTSNKPIIKPEKEFDKLVEIPLNQKYSNIIELFLEDRKKDLNTISS